MTNQLDVMQNLGGLLYMMVVGGLALTAIIVAFLFVFCWQVDRFCEGRINIFCWLYRLFLNNYLVIIDVFSVVSLTISPSIQSQHSALPQMLSSLLFAARRACITHSSLLQRLLVQTARRSSRWEVRTKRVQMTALSMSPANTYSLVLSMPIRTCNAGRAWIGRPTA